MPDAVDRPDHRGRVVIVGGGGAGAATARALRRGGYDGEVVLLSGEPDAPYDRTALSKGALLDPLATPPGLLPDRGPDDGGIDLRTGEAAAAIEPDEHLVRTSAGIAIGYDHLVIATGSAPRHLALPGAEHPSVHTLRELSTWDRLRDAVQSGGRLVVVGGGLIGLEVAAAARHHGTEVTVVEVADRLMGRVLPATVADVIASAHAERGVDLQLGVQPTAFLPDGGVALADGRSLPADAVLVAVGSMPRVQLAADAGLPVADGVLVDPQMRTADPHILAAGDVAQVVAADGTPTPRTESWTPAIAMGQHAARTIMGEEAPYAEVPWMWSDQYDLRVQAAGASVDGVEQVLRGGLGEREGLVVIGVQGDRVVGVAGVSEGNGVGRTVRAVQQLIQRGTAVDPAVLSDPATDLRALARG